MLLLISTCSSSSSFSPASLWISNFTLLGLTFGPFFCDSFCDRVVVLVVDIALLWSSLVWDLVDERRLLLCTVVFLGVLLEGVALEGEVDFLRDEEILVGCCCFWGSEELLLGSYEGAGYTL